MLTLAVLHICSADVVSFSRRPKRAACGLTGPTQFNSTQLNSTQLNSTQLNSSVHNLTTIVPSCIILNGPSNPAYVLLEDGLEPLLDLRFADDILLFCTTLDKACLLLDELVASLARVGLTLNFEKTKIVTTQAQPPQQLQTRGGVTVDVLDRASSHKWLARVFAPCWRLP